MNTSNSSLFFVFISFSICCFCQCVSGNCENGFGIYKWANGASYEGNWLNGQMSGKGKYFSSNGNTYEGNWLAHEKWGKGKMIWKDGSIYEGDWVAGYRSGFGKLILPNGDVYEGSFVDDSRNGFGKQTNINGEIYEGEWIYGIKNGYGKTFSRNFLKEEGFYYKGVLIENYVKKYQFDDQGMRLFDFWENQKCIEGDCINGKGILSGDVPVFELAADFVNGIPKFGFLKYTFSEGTVYEGSFISGSRHGKGKYTYSSGTVYEGNFVQGKLTGKGKVTWPSGTYYEGDLRDGKRTGKGKDVKIHQNGDIKNSEGYWLNDKFLQKYNYEIENITFPGSVTNVDFSTADGKIMIKFDLICEDCPYSANIETSFVSDNGKIFTPKSIDGDVYNVMPGINKQIFWNPTLDNLNLRGRFKAMVTVK